MRYKEIISFFLVFLIFKLLKNEESFGKSLSFAFSAKCFVRNFKCLFQSVFKNLLPFILIFLNAMTFIKFKTH